jgi:hypothetical protein
MTCKHKFIHLETVKWKQQAGRNTVTYIMLDRFFCEKCLEKKESKQTHDDCTGEKYGLPDWAKTITEYVDMGYRY